jgi:2-polyprenyl-3-methyl-5-hydroxy-6-metoxy-1,4-benzoquinol methylase
MKFGEQRTVRPDVGAGHRLFFRLFGVAEPAHYLHHRYLRRALDSLEGKAPRKILDAGCGGGDYTLYLARLFPEATVLGIDIDRSLIARNRESARLLGLERVSFEVADLAGLAGQSFDLIVCIDVLEHIREQRTALANLARALAPGGTAFLHLPTVRPKPVPFSRFLGEFHAWAEDEHIADELTGPQFVERVAGAGLEIDDVRGTFARGAGELANSLFSLPYRNVWYNRLFQLGFAPICRALTLLDELPWMGPRYAVAVVARKGPGGGAEDRRGAGSGHETRL